MDKKIKFELEKYLVKEVPEIVLSYTEPNEEELFSIWIKLGDCYLINKKFCWGDSMKNRMEIFLALYREWKDRHNWDNQWEKFFTDSINLLQLDFPN